MLKKFNEFLNEDWWDDHRDAPWNRSEAEPEREIDWFTSKEGRQKLNFIVVARANDEIAILRDKRNDKLYVYYFEDDDDLKEYTVRTSVGENDYEYEEPDDEALEAIMTDTLKDQSNKGVFRGVDAFERGERFLLLEIPLAEYLANEYFEKYTKAENSSDNRIRKNARVWHGFSKKLETIVKNRLVENSAYTEDRKYTAGGVILIYGNRMENGERNLYAAYIRGVKKFARKETDNDIFKIRDDIYRISIKDGILVANRIQYDAKSLKQYVGLSDLFVSINGKTKTPLWRDTVNITNIGNVLKEIGGQIKNLDVRL